MMDFITGSSLANALAPRLEVGQEALHDALRSRDSRRAVRIIEKVSSNNLGRRRSSSRAIAGQRDEEVDLNAPDSRGLRPIHLAALSGMSETVQALVRAGVPVDAMGAGGNTALHLAAYNRQDGVVAVLVGAGASPTQENSKGKTPVDLAQGETTMTLMCQLHYAAERSMLDNLVALVAKGVPINVLGRGGNTPLHASAASGTPDAARLLLARGADPLRRNADGKTPLDLARGKSLSTSEPAARIVEIVELLERAEAEAVAERAEKAARLEAERASQPVREVYTEGEEVVYVRDGEEHPAVVITVHRDDEEPYYTVRVLATGRERQTNANRLVRRPCEMAAEAGKDNQQEGENGDTEAVDGDAAGSEGLTDAADPTSGVGISGSTSAENNNSSGNSKRTRRSGGGCDDLGFEDGAEAAGTKIGDEWARARELFLRATTESTRKGCREGTPLGAAGSEVPGEEAGVPTREASEQEVNPLRTLAAAFGASPVEKANDILSRSVAQILLGGEVGLADGIWEGIEGNDGLASHSPGRKEDTIHGGGDNINGDDGHGGDDGVVAMDEDREDVGSAPGAGGRPNASATGGSAVQRTPVSREKVAHAIADACRDIVFRCLVTQPAPVDDGQVDWGRPRGLGPAGVDAPSHSGTTS